MALKLRRGGGQVLLGSQPATGAHGFARGHAWVAVRLFLVCDFRQMTSCSRTSVLSTVKSG